MPSAIRTRFALTLVTLVAAVVAVPAASAKTHHDWGPLDRSYSPTVANGTASTSIVRQAGPGGKVYDLTGGYYDPQRSIYVPGAKATD